MKFIRKIRSWFTKKPTGLPNGDPELVQRIQRLLATELYVSEIVGQLEFIRCATPEEFDNLFKKPEPRTPSYPIPAKPVMRPGP